MNCNKSYGLISNSRRPVVIGMSVTDLKSRIPVVFSVLDNGTPVRDKAQSNDSFTLENFRHQFSSILIISNFGIFPSFDCSDLVLALNCLYGKYIIYVKF
jgi:hypothetical protein